MLHEKKNYLVIKDYYKQHSHLSLWQQQHCPNSSGTGQQSRAGKRFHIFLLKTTFGQSYFKLAGNFLSLKTTAIILKQRRKYLTLV